MKPTRATCVTTACIGALLTFSATTGAQTLDRKPYLQKTTPSAITVVWTTLESVESVVKYGASPTTLDKTATGASGSQHEVSISGLSPATRYYYSVGTTTQTLAGGDATHYFDTAPTPGTPAKFRAWIVGDSGTGGSPQLAVRDAMLSRVGSYRPHIYLHMGDIAYNDGTTLEFTNNFFAAYDGILRNTVTWPTMGNHEGHSSDSGTQSGPYYTAYVLPKAGEAGGLPSGTEAYYSFDWANVHFIVLDSHDSDRSPNGPMLTWMKNDLASTKQEWVIAYWHHPPYSKGTHDSDTEGQLVDMRENALPILEAGGVDLVLAGHSHIYERSFLVDGAYDTPTTAGSHIKDNGDGAPLGTGPYKKPTGLAAHAGAVYVVAGHGGASVGQSGTHPLMYFAETQRGSCILDVQGNRLGLFNVRHDGQISDRFALVKGTGIVIAAPDGGETLSPGTQYDIKWATAGNVPNVKLEWSADDGGSWQVIAASVPNTGTHAWTVPTATTDRALVRVTSTSDAKVFDESNAGFVIGAAGPQTVIAFGDTWKYHDQGVDLKTAWLSPTFDDSGWASGPGQLGYGDGDEATTLLDANPNYPSAYFRKTISLPSEVTEATLKVLHDDGVVVWVNGTEVLSKYVTSSDYASFSSASQDNEVSTGSVALSPSPFIVGDNVVAAMVKQSSGSSSDLSFDLELRVKLSVPSSGGSGGSAGGGGTSGAGGIAGGPSAGGAAASSNGGTGGGSSVGGGSSAGGSSDDGGCGCRTSRAPLGSLALFGIALGLLGTRRRRSRR